MAIESSRHKAVGSLFKTAQYRPIGKPQVAHRECRGCATTVVRYVVLVQGRHGVDDPLWDWYSLDLCSSAEMTCGIICGCLPALSAFIHHIHGLSTQNQIEETRRQKPSYPKTTQQRKMASLEARGSWS